MLEGVLYGVFGTVVLVLLTLSAMGIVQAWQNRNRE